MAQDSPTPHYVPITSVSGCGGTELEWGCLAVGTTPTGTHGHRGPPCTVPPALPAAPVPSPGTAEWDKGWWPLVLVREPPAPLPQCPTALASPHAAASLVCASRRLAPARLERQLAMAQAVKDLLRPCPCATQAGDKGIRVGAGLSQFGVPGDDGDEHPHCHGNGIPAPSTPCSLGARVMAGLGTAVSRVPAPPAPLGPRCSSEVVKQLRIS